MDDCMFACQSVYGQYAVMSKIQGCWCTNSSMSNPVECGGWSKNFMFNLVASLISKPVVQLFPVGVGGTALTFVEPLILANLTFACPNRTTLGSTIVCNLTMNAGSHLRITTGTFAGQLGTSRVPEPYHDWMQVTAMRLPTGMTSCPTTKLVIAGSSARYSGNIFELSVNLANAGTLQVMLLRVRCSSGSYSYTQDACTTVSSDGINCNYSTTNRVLVGSQMACSSTDLTDCGAGLRQIRLDTVINVEPYDYEVIEKTTLTSTVDGWQLLKLPNSWSVFSGDRIGLLTGASMPLTCATPSTAFQSADLISNVIIVANVGDIIGASLLSRSNVRFQIGAWIRYPQQTELNYRAAQVGNMTVSVTLDAYANSLSTVALTYTTTVVNVFEADGLVNKTFNLGEQAMLELKSFTGNATQFIWNFGDGSAIVTTSVQRVVHVFSSPGHFRVDVNVTDGTASFLNTDNVTIVTIFDFTSITVNPSLAGQPSNISLIISTNAAFTCSWWIAGQLVHTGSETMITHMFNASGLFEVRVSCTDYSVTIEKTANQTVTEGIAGLAIASSALTVGSAQTLIFTFVQGVGLVVQLNLNGQIKQTTVNYVSNTIVSEAFSVLTPTKMVYVLDVNVSSTHHQLTGEVTFNEPITGIQLEQTAYEIGPQRNVAFSFTQGSNITAQLTLNGLSRTVQVDEQQKRIVSEAISVPTATQMTYLLTINNPLGSVDRSGTVDFVEPITGVQLTTTIFSVGSANQLIFSFASGSSLSGQLLIGDQSKHVIVDYAQKQVISDAFAVLLPSEYNYQLNVSNQLGKVYDSGSVGFYEPITSKFTLILWVHGR
ncbi:hypothetical protein PHET_06577 [Paragonimus heterotremus]|uniref:PKD domain-containing protein n=1 Tax=Paragonimus heterotremus TaxID=100268 RepID=A0A8J4T8F4_9TREM|nr:hypothetical protein PHET_06577 [Paragonimus heterotremus]